jgi:hypothetical protein
VQRRALNILQLASRDYSWHQDAESVIASIAIHKHELI